MSETFSNPSSNLRGNLVPLSHPMGRGPERGARPLLPTDYWQLTTDQVMKALRFENKQLQVADVARPEAAGEILVRVRLSGICNTDLEIARGYAGFEGTLGHEFVGVIDNVSEARPSGRATHDNGCPRGSGLARCPPLRSGF